MISVILANYARHRKADPLSNTFFYLFGSAKLRIKAIVFRIHYFVENEKNPLRSHNISEFLFSFAQQKSRLLLTVSGCTDSQKIKIKNIEDFTSGQIAKSVYEIWYHFAVRASRKSCYRRFLQLEFCFCCTRKHSLFLLKPYFCHQLPTIFVQHFDNNFVFSEFELIWMLFELTSSFHETRNFLAVLILLFPLSYASQTVFACLYPGSLIV